MGKYNSWIKQQSQDFIDEVCCGNKIPDTFVDYGCQDITLDELKALDAKYITDVPEGREK